MLQQGWYGGATFSDNEGLVTHLMGMLQMMVAALYFFAVKSCDFLRHFEVTLEVAVVHFTDECNINNR